MFDVDGNSEAINVERWAGTNPVYNGAGNFEIIQSGGTNFPSMIADLNDSTGAPTI